jgi:hypothetical protein
MSTQRILIIAIPTAVIMILGLYFRFGRSRKP